MKWVAAHGVPLGAPVWSELPNVVCPPLEGIATNADRSDWSVAAFAEELSAHVDASTILIGHDFGGLVAATVALHQPVRAVVLTGTALGPYWTAMRATTLPGLEHYFYRRSCGRRFVRGGTRPAHRDRLTHTMEPHLQAIDDLDQRMATLARQIRVPRRLGQSLASRCPVFCIYGRNDPWYPPMVGKAVARASSAPLRFIDAHHYGMYTASEAFSQELLRVEKATS